MINRPIQNNSINHTLTMYYIYVPFRFWNCPFHLTFSTQYVLRCYVSACKNQHTSRVDKDNGERLRSKYFTAMYLKMDSNNPSWKCLGQKRRVLIDPWFCKQSVRKSHCTSVSLTLRIHTKSTHSQMLIILNKYNLFPTEIHIESPLIYRKNATF